MNAPTGPNEWDLHDIVPSFREKLAAQKQITVYFIPGTARDGQKTYMYVVASATVHEELMKSLKLGVVPPFAVIVETGYGLPPAQEIKAKIKHYYGFDHDAAAAA